MYTTGSATTLVSPHHSIISLHRIDQFCRVVFLAYMLIWVLSLPFVFILFAPLVYKLAALMLKWDFCTYRWKLFIFYFLSMFSFLYSIGLNYYVHLYCSHSYFCNPFEADPSQGDLHSGWLDLVISTLLELWWDPFFFGLPLIFLFHL